MSTYLVLIYGNEYLWADMPPAEVRRLTAGHRTLAAAAGQSLLATHELTPASSATTLRADTAGELTVSEGPLIRAEESVGGYYLLEAGDLDEVIALAGELYEATASHGGVEIRRVAEG